MEEKDTTVKVRRLSEDVQYYNNVFKKIEKISSVVFYVLSFKKDTSENSLLEKSLAEKSFTLHELSLKSLFAVGSAHDDLYAVQAALVALMSALELAVAARAVPTDIAELLIEQIDAVQRYLANHYLPGDELSIVGLHSFTVDTTAPKVKASESQPAASKRSTSSTAARRAPRVAVPQGDISSDAYLVYSQLNDRTERIKTVLEAKPQATVKDIAEIITDVSEKTIQRDLNSLIEKGQVRREGERRWSKYSVVKT